MYRTRQTFRALATPWLSGSVSSLPSTNETVHIRHVRVLRPFLGRQRVLKAARWVGLLAVPLFVLDISFGEDDEGSALNAEDGAAKHTWEAQPNPGSGASGAIKRSSPNASQQDKQGQGNKDVLRAEGWFIPLGPPRARSGVYYKETDPEWRAFLKLNAQPDHAKRVYEAVYHYAARDALKNKDVQKHIGQLNSTRFTDSYLEYPLNTPPTYERFGIGITEDAIALGSTPMHPTEAIWMRSGVYPLAVWDSVWAGFRAALGKVYPNSWLDSPSQLEVVDFVKRDGAKDGSGSRRGPTQTIQMPPPSEPADQAPMGGAREGRAFPWIPTQQGPSISKPESEVANAIVAFRNAARTKRHEKMLAEIVWPARGSCLLHGQLDLHGSRGVAIFKVIAAYDPTKKALTLLLVFPVNGNPLNDLRPKDS